MSTARTFARLAPTSLCSPTSPSSGLSLLASSLLLLASTGLVATPALAQDADRSVADGGVYVDGWQLRIDRRAMERGSTADDSRMAMEGDAFRLSVGPAGYFWNPANRASGDYTVMATFEEHAMNAGHPHPYGIFIGGSDLESEMEKLLYCIVYGDGTWVAKTFHGENVTTVAERQPSEAIRRANAEGEATNEIGWRVEDGSATCVINGEDVHTFAASDVVGPDKIDALDGVYGIRVSHNLELTVRDFGLRGGM